MLLTDILELVLFSATLLVVKVRPVHVLFSELPTCLNKKGAKSNMIIQLVI